MKIEQIVCSETSACIIQTPGNYPKENIIQSLNILIDIVVFDYIPFPVLTHTKGMTHFQDMK